jgi:hypothetical protein
MTRPLSAVLLLASLAGCGYHTGSLMPPGTESVAVGIFGNETYYRHAEVTYTRELTRELVRRAHVDVRGPDDAQAVISGRILSIPRITLVEDRRDQILEEGVVVSVEVHVDDPRTGLPLVDPFIVRRRAESIVPRGESLQDAIDEAVRDVARETVVRIQGASFLRERLAADRDP